jgi:hypothetical protein
MKIYLAGPMTYKPHFNYPAFNAAAKMLRECGHEVFNPAERDIEWGQDWGKLVPDGDPKKAAAIGFNLREALAADLAYICNHAEAIALLPGWEGSTGARIERSLAQALKLEEIFLP